MSTDTPVALATVIRPSASVAESFRWLAHRSVGGHSQHGEDGIVAAIFDRIGSDEFGWVVDIGAADGVSLSNSRDFVEKNWLAVLVECNPERYAELLRNSVGKLAATVMAEVKPGGTGDASAVEIICRAEVLGNRVPEAFDLLSIDVDSFDHAIFSEIIDAGFRPRVVCIEHYDLFGPLGEADWIPPPGSEGISGETGYVAQATYKALDRIASERGYTPAARTRTNSIYVRSDLAPMVEDSAHGLEPGIRLNIGAGRTLIPGFVSVDIDSGVDAADLPYPDDSVTEIYASHVLEHISHCRTMEVLREWVRVLKPGGKIYIAVPDMEKILADPNLTFQNRQHFLMGSHTDEHDVHGAIFTRQSLQTLMEGVGLDFVGEFEPFLRDCSSYPISTNLCGFKREFRRPEKPKIAALSSWGRLTFSDQVESLIAIVQHRIVGAHMKVGGAYWEKAVTAGVEGLLDSDADWILFTDGDSLYSKADVEALVKVLMDDPSVAVVYAVQASRHNDQPLVYSEKTVYEGEASRVVLGHFGLTLIRREVFERIPQPWFMSLPDPKSGRWAKGELVSDADIHFWRLLHQRGFKVVQANSVVIGHLELVSKWVTDKPGVAFAYQPIQHYHKHGKPACAKFDPKAIPPKKRAP